MAVARVGAWFDGNNKVSGTTAAWTTTTAVSKGDCLVAIVATDNSGASGAAPTATLDLDVAGAAQSFTLVASANRTPGSSSNDGVSLFVFALVADQNIASGKQLALSLGTSTTAKAITVDQFTGVTNVSMVEGSPATATGSGTAPTVTRSTVTSGNLIIGALAVENSSATLTNDTDTTNGTFVAFTSNVTSGGSAVTNVRAAGSSKITTATGNQTYNPTTVSADHAILLVELKAGPYVIPSGALGLAADVVIEVPALGFFGMPAGHENRTPALIPFNNHRYLQAWQMDANTETYGRRLLTARSQEDGWVGAGPTSVLSVSGVQDDMYFFHMSDSQVAGVHHRWTGPPVASDQLSRTYGTIIHWNSTDDTLTQSSVETPMLPAGTTDGGSGPVHGARISDTDAVFAVIQQTDATPTWQVRACVGQLAGSTDTTFTYGSAYDFGSPTGVTTTSSWGEARIVVMSATRAVLLATGLDKTIHGRLLSISGTTLSALTSWVELSADYNNWDATNWQQVDAAAIDSARFIMVSSASSASGAEDRSLKAKVVSISGDAFTLGTALTVASVPMGLANAMTYWRISDHSVTVLGTDEIAIIAHRAGADEGTYGSIASATISAATTLTISKPTGVITQSTLLAMIAVDGDDGSITVTPPSGWTFDKVARNSGNVAIYSYYRSVVDSTTEPASYDFIFSGAVSAVGAIVRLDNSVIDESFDALWSVANTGNSTNPVATATPVVTAEIVVAATGTDVAHTVPSGFTQLLNTAQGTLRMSIGHDANVADEGDKTFTAATAQWATLGVPLPGSSSPEQIWVLDAGASGTTLTLVAGPEALFSRITQGGGRMSAYPTTEATPHKLIVGTLGEDPVDGTNVSMNGFIDVPSTVVTSLVVSDCTHGHALDNVVLTQTHVLAGVAESFHGHANDAFTLVQAHALAGVVDLTHAHVVENVVLTQQTTLVVADAIHGHATDAVALAQQHVLIMQDAAHEHVAETFAITQAHTIVVADSMHGHVADAIVITQVHVLAGLAESFHDHGVESFAISQQHSLMVADAAHAHSAENVAMTQQHTLAGVADLAHGHAVESVLLTITAVLAVVDSFHGHGVEAVALTQVHSLIVGDSEHAHGVESFAITQAHALAGLGNLAHAHAVDPVALVQQHALAGLADLAHGHANDSVVLAVQGDLVVAEMVHGHTVDALAITQQHVLVVVDLDHQHGVETFVLTQGHVLTIADALHGHISDIPTFTQLHLLAVDEATHQHQAESFALVQQQSLSGLADLFHGHTLEAAPLAQQHNITPAESAHSHATEPAGALTQVHVLTVAEALHAHSAENIAIVQQHTLVVVDAVHAHAVEVVVLTTEDTLVVSDSFHGHGTEIPAITQQHTIVVADLDHQHAVEAFAITQQHSLVPSDSAHAHAVEVVVLSVEAFLAISDAAHAHQVESVALVQQHVLVVDDVSHSHDAAPVDLVQQHAITVADSAHQHAVEAILLTEDAILVIANLAHQHATENVAIVQDHQLLVADAVHRHAVETLAITQAHYLLPDDSTHASTIESIILVANATLEVADAEHQHVVDAATLTQLHLLAIVGMVHGHAVEAFALTQVHNLTLADLLHGHAVEGIFLALRNIHITWGVPGRRPRATLPTPQSQGLVRTRRTLGVSQTDQTLTVSRPSPNEPNI